MTALEPSMSGMGRLRRASLGVLVVRSVGAGATFGLQLVAAKILITQQFGIFSTLLAAATLGSLIAKLGFDNAAVRFIPALRQSGETRHITEFIGFAVRFVGVASVLLALAWTVVAAALGARWTLHAVAAGLLVSLALLRLGEGILRAFERHGLASSGISTVVPAASMCGLLAVRLIHGSLDAFEALVVIVVCQGGLVAIFATAIRRERAHTAGSRDESEVHSQRSVWLRSAAHLTVYSAAVLIVGQSDVLVVAALFDSDRAGGYALIWRMTAVMTLPLMALNFVVGPRLAALGEGDSAAQMVAGLRTPVRLITGCSLVLGIAMITFRTPLLSFFDATYIELAPVLLVLVAAQVVNAAGGPVATTLNVQGRERHVGIVLLVSAFFNLALSAAFAPLFGPVGIALGTLVTTFAWNAALGRSLSGSSWFPFVGGAAGS